MNALTEKPRVGIGIMLLRGGKILLGKRHEDPIKASSLLHGEGTWTMPGGKVRSGEKLEDAAYREVLEETGIRIRKDKMKIISVADDVADDAHFTTIGFLCQDFDGEPRVMEEEIVEWEWFSFDNLPKPIFLPSEKILKNFLQREYYKN